MTIQTCYSTKGLLHRLVGYCLYSDADERAIKAHGVITLSHSLPVTHSLVAGSLVMCAVADVPPFPPTQRLGLATCRPFACF